MKTPPLKDDTEQLVKARLLDLLTPRLLDHAVFATDIYGQIVSWNEGCRQLFGFENKAVLGKQLAILIDRRYHYDHQLLSFFPCSNASEPKVFASMWQPKGADSFQAETELIPFTKDSELLVAVLIHKIRPSYQHELNHLLASTTHHIGGEIMAIKSIISDFEDGLERGSHDLLKHDIQNMAENAYLSLMLFYSELSTLLRKADQL